jgi:hypothetical protein
MLDLAIYGICALIGLYLLLIIFRQAKENEQLRNDLGGVVTANAELLHDHNTDANGQVKRGERGRFVSVKGGAA